MNFATKNDANEAGEVIGYKTFKMVSLELTGPTSLFSRNEVLNLKFIIEHQGKERKSVFPVFGMIWILLFKIEKPGRKAVSGTGLIDSWWPTHRVA